MKTVTLRSHVGSDGVLRLEVPVDFKDADLEIILVIQPQDVAPQKPEDLGWPPGFFEQTYDALADDAMFFRHDQGEFEQRESLE